MNKSTLVIWMLVLLGGCGSIPDQTAALQAIDRGGSRWPERASAVETALYAQYDEWRGTPYRYGGYSKNGVDCSGFVHLTLRDRLDSAVPRTTVGQAQAGRPVPRGSWQAGDLVFFRTGPDKHHVGIYVEDGYFLHASTSDGVTLSSLEDPYWSARYWRSRRLANALASR